MIEVKITVTSTPPNVSGPRNMEAHQHADSFVTGHGEQEKAARDLFNNLVANYGLLKNKAQNK